MRAALASVDRDDAASRDEADLLLESLNEGVSPKTVRVTATDGDRVTEFEARLRIDTPMEAQYYRHGGILPYMLRQMAG